MTRLEQIAYVARVRASLWDSTQTQDQQPVPFVLTDDQVAALDDMAGIALEAA